jgi:spore maturation protein CgeB
LFEAGKEVIVYDSTEECAELIRYYLQHEKERTRIARAGQERTLKEHTYYHRMQELLDILKHYV